jgi:hypothetical protein
VKSRIATQNGTEDATGCRRFTPPSHGTQKPVEKTPAEAQTAKGKGLSASRLARPAALGKNHAAVIGRAAKRARLLEGFIAFGSGRQLTRNFQGVCGGDVPIRPISLG